MPNIFRNNNKPGVSNFSGLGILLLTAAAMAGSMADMAICKLGQAANGMGKAVSVMTPAVGWDAAAAAGEDGVCIEGDDD